MKEKIDYQFSKHYKRLIENLKELSSWTPATEQIISVNYSKLQQDINTVVRVDNHDNSK